MGRGKQEKGKTIVLYSILPAHWGRRGVRYGLPCKRGGVGKKKGNDGIPVFGPIFVSLGEPTQFWLRPTSEGGEREGEKKIKLRGGKNR